jgi:choline-sulfatase
MWGGLVASVAGGTAKPAPNVLVIMTDQQTADALSFRMGREYIHTPALDRLAARGTYFSRAYAPNPLCMPARNSSLTGRYPHETGITDNTAMYDRRRLDPTEFVTLGTRFQRAGYRTGYFGKWHLAYDTAAPETRETSLSADQPPISTATSFLPVIARLRPNEGPGALCRCA